MVFFIVCLDSVLPSFIEKIKNETPQAKIELYLQAVSKGDKEKALTLWEFPSWWDSSFVEFNQLKDRREKITNRLIGAKIILNIDISDHELLQTAAQIEGHADNAAACLLGGLVLVRSENDALHFTHREIQPITAVIAIPEYSHSTKAAREVLPEKVLLEDAVFNISHTVELVQVFREGN